VSTVFRLILGTRDKLYRSGILTSRTLLHPVISIGNLTMGGTGKTPLVIALAAGMRDRGYHPVILSRGYRRTSRGVRQAGSSWEEVGDEPYLMVRRLGNVPVVVGEDRYAAGVFAQKKGLGDLFILDDGFQHRRLHRDVDIVTIDPIEWARGESLLPAGRWREPRSALDRAHIACIQEFDGTAIPQLTIPSFRVQTRVDGLYKDEALVPLDAVRGRSVTAFAGIAKPERFFATLESLGIEPKLRIRFRDHHKYSDADIRKLQGDILITTEKDAVRLAGRGLSNFLYLRISANIPDFDRLLETVIARLPKQR
jgi:tetraacyldisaccharide 4'-kinase